MVRCPRCQRRFPPSRECPAHGKPTAVVEVDEIPAVTPPAGYTLGALVATGGTSVIYSLEPAAILKWGRWADRDIHARFAMDADVLRALGPPATPAYLAHGTADDYPYLVMEHVQGETLAAWMARTGERGGLGEILALLTRITRALATLHDAGYVHRDLKPENIVIGARGVRLLDFGLAKPLREARDITQIGAIVGTPHYIAPEQIRTGGVVDQRADIYSFGVIAFEMLAGRPPFVGERRAIEYQHQVAKPPSVRETRSIPAELDALVHRCLAKDLAARPQSAAELATAIGKLAESMATIRGIGGAYAAPEPKPLGNQCQVALAWIVGGDPVAVARAASDVQGILVRRRGDGILVAFTALHHDAPVMTAITTCRDLAVRSRVTIHVATALVRRSAQGKPTVYGDDVEHVERWEAPAPAVGLVLTAEAAKLVPSAAPHAALKGFHTERRLAQPDPTELETAVPVLVGRGDLVDRIVAAVIATPAIVVNISGEPGMGKSRVLAAVVDKLRARGRELTSIQPRRRFAGEPADDARVEQALAGHELVAVDDAHLLSRGVRDRLVASARAILVTPEPAFEVPDGRTDRLAIELPRLPFDAAAVLLREQLRPARVIPDVLIERLALRGAGNPAVVLALARDMRRRGGLRRHAGSDEWYVAADGLDTLLVPPDAAWLAERALENLAPELAPVVRACAGLGPQFCAQEVAAVTGVTDADRRLAWLVKDRMFDDRGGWYEFADPHLQDATYDFVLDERTLVHTRALDLWLANRQTNTTGWLARVAYHAAGAGQLPLAGTCWTSLAHTAIQRGNHEQAERLLARVLANVPASLPAIVRDAL